MFSQQCFELVNTKDFLYPKGENNPSVKPHIVKACLNMVLAEFLKKEADNYNFVKIIVEIEVKVKRMVIIKLLKVFFI